MPVFDCHCKACDMDFKTMISLDAVNPRPKCPYCRSTDTTFDLIEETLRFVVVDGAVNAKIIDSCSAYGTST